MANVNDCNTDQRELAARQRLDSFKMGNSDASKLKLSHTRPSSFHGRSHSRSSSVTSAPLSISTSTNFAKPTNETSLQPNPPPPLPPSKKRPNSHHRRRSSVSTRHESAEMMGVSLPDLPISSSEGSINFGEKDSIRRRALMALEGKLDLAFTRVEIPELTTPDITDKSFDFPKTFTPSSNTGFGPGVAALMSKRDSFKHLSASASSKDPLHTLVEEEEEEEEGSEDKENIATNVVDLTEPASHPSVITKSVNARPRPANLTLRPLALNPENLVTAVHGLPTPGPSPSPNNFRSGPKSLALANFGHVTEPPSRHRSSPTSSTESAGQADEKMVKRRSSISYKTSGHSAVLNFAGLPTPGATPTATERNSLSSARSSLSSTSSDEEFLKHRPLSVSEQHFLFKSHNALLARIQDLEHALSSRHQNTSPSSTPLLEPASIAEPANDEMLELVANLKGERDELKKDVEGWKKRVCDLEQQVGIFAKRAETERRDAWVARSHVGLLEVEKTKLEKTLAEKTVALEEALRNYDVLLADFETMKSTLGAAVSAADAESARLAAALDEEVMKRMALERKLEQVDPMATPTARTFQRDAMSPVRPKNKSLGYTDSQGTVFDDESSPSDAFYLKTVAEEEENVNDDSDHENPLLGYEDEEDLDLDLQSEANSSIGSLDEMPRSTAHLKFGADKASPSPSHAPNKSLSTSWTFPFGQTTRRPTREPEEVDRFFGCLEDVEGSPPSAVLTTMASHESSKGLFSMGLQDEVGDDLPPFMLPSDASTGSESLTPSPCPSSNILDAVLEEIEDEDDDDDDVFGAEISGIKITFTPPSDQDDVKFDFLPSMDSPDRKMVSPYEPFAEEEEDDAKRFAFAPPPLKSGVTSPPAKSVSSPSSIPRPISRRPSYSTNEHRSTPPSHRDSDATPPKRIPMPSFIPQPVSSPIKNVKTSKLVTAPSTTVLRQPRRKSTSTTYPNKSSSMALNGSAAKPIPPSSTPTHFRLYDFTANVPMNTPSRSSDIPTPAYPDSPLGDVSVSTSTSTLSDADSRELQDPVIPQSHAPAGSSFSSFMSSTFTGQLSLGTFANMIPMSWAPRSPIVAAAGSPPSAVRSIEGQDVKALNGKGPRYVTKEKQLERLRNQLDSKRVPKVLKEGDVPRS